MKIILENLPHQKDSIDAILKSFSGLDQTTSNNLTGSMFANPLVNNSYDEKANIDVKMETGTGKTFVYTKLMYELHEKYGLFKFVIVVPSPAIKEGTKNFIQSDYAKQFFSRDYKNTRIELNVINAGDFKTKSGRKNFPAQLLNFIEGSRQNTNTIEVLLINADMLRSKSMNSSDYDQTVIGGITNPIEGIKSTRPILFIDEPHRFPRDKANYSSITKLEPQLIVRFGATFPDVIVGVGKNKSTKKDYYRGKPQFDLNAVESFNNGLVKGIDIYYPNLPEIQATNRYKVVNVSSKELILKKGNNVWTLKVGDNLAEIDSDFEGDIEYIGSKQLSNELELEKGMELIPGTYRFNYQELIIQDAINKHFEIEQENFIRDNLRENNVPKIKTLSLFFIDKISSYRDSDGWLKVTFERLLKNKLTSLIKEFSLRKLPREQEYLEFLNVTLSSLLSENQDVHGGYFGEDLGSRDEAIQNQVKDILKNKNKLLTFKDESGKWQTRRFLFSKWTLREGWDNPNVFVIAKLRTSGSENSKIQEVGRGLRLPVDETGRRLKQEEYKSRLAFLIGYDERDFAKLLIGEINQDSKIEFNERILTKEVIKLIVENRKQTNPKYNDLLLLKELDELGIINRNNEFKKEVMINNVSKDGIEWLLEYYPEIRNTRIQEDKINDNPKSTTNLQVKLNKDNWEKVKELWRVFSNRHMLEFERIPNTIEMIAEEIIGDATLYEKEIPTQTIEELVASEDKKTVDLNIKSKEYYGNYIPGMHYGEFIKKINQRTGIPIKNIHSNLYKLMKQELNGEMLYLSSISLENIASEFKRRFNEVFSQAYEYRKLNFYARTSIYNPETDTFFDTVNAEVLGTNIDSHSSKEDRYLYENPPMRYDSIDPERDLLRHEYHEKVTVFGKLPKRSIQVPKYTGGSTTPDFVYLIEKNNEKVYLLIETKAENMRIDDQKIIEIQKKFFNQLGKNNVQFEEATNPQHVYSAIQKLIIDEESVNEY